jgi:protocatechuate 3,4-dioxygenase beta subunit
MTSHGIITFTGICPGNYSLYYTSKTGYTRPDPATWNFTMECNDTAIYNRTLIKNAPDTCCNGIISGTLTDSSSGHPIAQAGVALYLGSTKIGIVYTDSLGKFQFAHLCPGSYDLKISASGYNPKSMAIKAGCNDVSNKLTIGLTKK